MVSAEDRERRRRPTWRSTRNGRWQAIGYDYLTDPRRLRVGLWPPLMMCESRVPGTEDATVILLWCTLVNRIATFSRAENLPPDRDDLPLTDGWTKTASENEHSAAARAR
jgi:hypothetical protein